MHTTAIEAMRLYCVYAGPFEAIKKKKNNRITNLQLRKYITNTVNAQQSDFKILRQ